MLGGRRGLFRKITQLTKVLVGLVLLSAGLILVGQWVFKLRTIEVVGEGLEIKIDEARFPTNLLFFPTQKLRQELIRDYPQLATVEVSQKFPSTLVITIATRRPAAKLLSDGREVYLDESGMVLGETSDFKSISGKFPQIKALVGQTRAGVKVDSLAVLASLQLIAVVKDGVIDTVSVSGPILQVKSGNTDIIIAQNSDITDKATTLQTLMSGFRIKGTLPKMIDLRFDKPVVRF